ncbi:MAG: hydrogenase 3 maturation endopeptidase HyCI, partial [Phycisphaerae bacterium]|nr:hydrogenase 3 maturation endopeptidase HyCI [Phycisphaerae bacterium]
IVTSSIAVVCIGNDLRGDDGAGPAVADALIRARRPYVYDAGSAPESFLMKIAATAPDVVLVVDALHFGAKAGAVALIEPDDLGGQSPSTHGPSPIAFLRQLAMVHDCPSVILGIQPQSTKLGQPMSRPVSQAVQRVVEALAALGRD